MKAYLALALLLGLAVSNGSLAAENAVPIPDCSAKGPNAENCAQWQSMVQAAQTGGGTTGVSAGAGPASGNPNSENGAAPAQVMSRCMTYALNSAHMTQPNAIAYCNRAGAFIGKTSPDQWRARVAADQAAFHGASARMAGPPMPMQAPPPGRPIPGRNEDRADPIVESGFRIGVGSMGGSITVPPKCLADCRKALMDDLARSGYAPSTGGDIIYAKAKAPSCDVKCQQALAAEMAKIVRSVIR